jgi:hypothetical protein
VEGNSYSAIPLLDFGSLRDEDEGDGRERRPWLSMRLPIGEASPLTRFITGLGEIIDKYLLDTEALQQDDAGESLEEDPWDEDLFFPPPLDLPSAEDFDQDEELQDEEDASRSDDEGANNGHETKIKQHADTASADVPTDADGQTSGSATGNATVTDLLMTTETDWKPPAFEAAAVTAHQSPE